MFDPISTTLALLVLALILFATEKLPVDIIGILLVMALILTGILTTQEALAGFGDSIIITIAGLFVLTGGLVKTGIVDIIGKRLYEVAGKSQLLLTGLIMVAAAISASILKNTTTTAMYLPVVLGIAEKTKMSPSKLLMPLAFGAILGGSCTLIGTSTNLAVSSAIERYGMAPYTMFELTAVGTIAAFVGIFYMLTVGIRLLPERGAIESFTKQYNIRDYISEIIVLPESRLVGKTLEDADISKNFDLNVLRIIRADEERIKPRAKETIQAGDILIVEGKISDILKIKSETGVEIKPDFELNDKILETDDIELFEVMIMRDSSFIGQTLKSLDFRQRYDLTVLAINRHGETIFEKLSEVPLKFGDVLLVQGRRRLLEPLFLRGELLFLEEVSTNILRSEKQRWALIAFGVFLLLSISGAVFSLNIPLVIAVLIGVLILLATKTIRYSEIYSLIDFRLLVLIASMLSFGVAMEKTGTDLYLAGLIKLYFEQYGPTALLAGFFILTVLLTQPMSNQAAALVVLPVAVKTAVSLGLNPRTFAVAVTYAASVSFITPLEPACVLVYTPGRYRFFDFVKVGSILTVLVGIVVILLVPVFWKF
ncbi:MAG: SLC13 family permease [Pyrinomonadaceae bacterium]|nr:SLC13 family permease [Pyrinomonadaceae bacterium]MCX7640617.1 SLC13 family permease [Pyrinomonadaceae bacterium]MDW8305155.1 SLC13 family permease [Acidobacteriota bacterium]